MKLPRVVCVAGAVAALLLVTVSQIPSTTPDEGIVAPQVIESPQINKQAVAEGVRSIRRTIERRLETLSVGATQMSTAPSTRTNSVVEPLRLSPPSSSYVHRFGETLLDDDVGCEKDVARSGVLECVERFGRFCVALSSCPQVVLVNRSKVSISSAASEVLSRNTILSRAIRSALSATWLPSTPTIATLTTTSSSAMDGAPKLALDTTWHCEFRDAFHLWNASLHRMVRYCNGPVARVDVPVRLREVVAAQCVDLFSVLSAADERVGVFASDRNATFLPEDPAANLSTRFPHGMVLPDDVAATIREYGPFLPLVPKRASSPSDRIHVVTATLPDALYDGPSGGDVSTEEFRIRRGAEESALRLCSSEKIHLAMEARGWFHLWSLSEEFAARELSRLLKAGPSMRHQHRAIKAEEEVPTGHRGCQKEVRTPVSVLCVGDTASRFLVQRLVRWASSVCTHCRSSPYRFIAEFWTMSLASISTNADDAFEFGQTMEFRESLHLRPSVVVLSVGQRDALAISLLNRTLLEVRLAAMIVRYAAMDSKPEVLVVTPWQIFDTKTEAHKRKMRVTALEYGPTARRLAEEVAPAIRSVVRNLRAAGGAENVHLVDVHATHLMWLERAFRGRILAEGENSTLAEPLKATEAALLGLHYEARSANYFLMQQLPDGHTPRKLTQKMLSLSVLMALLQPR